MYLPSPASITVSKFILDETQVGDVEDANDGLKQFIIDGA